MSINPETYKRRLRRYAQEMDESDQFRVYFNLRYTQMCQVCERDINGGYTAYIVIIFDDSGRNNRSLDLCIDCADKIYDKLTRRMLKRPADVAKNAMSDAIKKFKERLGVLHGVQSGRNNNLSR